MRTKNKRADRVWDRLIQSYGTRVAEMYGLEMPKPWVDAVDDLSDEQIAYGLKAVVRESPIHPPALGQFVQCCVNMPVAQRNDGPSIQAQLCEYAALRLQHLIRKEATPAERWTYSRPWTYCYREWRDETRPKGMEKCAECVGVVIDLDNGKKIGWTVTEMLGDTEGHARVMRNFRPGPYPSEAQMAAYHGTRASGIGKYPADAATEAPETANLDFG